jgi:hypothetical protein
MQPPLIILIPWVLSLLLEFWLIGLLVRKRLYRDLPVFSSMVIIYALLDFTVLVAMLSRVYAYPMFALREIANAVLRTWVLIDLCRRLLTGHIWTKRLLMLALLASAAVLIGVGYPYFEGEFAARIATTYMQLGVWFRTAYFTQIGVIAVLFLLHSRSMISGFTREIGIAIGIATSSGAELVSMTLRGRPRGDDAALFSLNYIGMATAVVIWMMFLSPHSGMAEEQGFDGQTIADRTAYSASNSAT